MFVKHVYGYGLRDLPPGYTWAFTEVWVPPPRYRNLVQNDDRKFVVNRSGQRSASKMDCTVLLSEFWASCGKKWHYNSSDLLRPVIMGKPKGKSAESQGKSTLWTTPLVPGSTKSGQSWKPNYAWVVNTLPATVKELIKPQVIAAFDEFVSSSEFTQALSDSFKFDIGVHKNFKVAQNEITRSNRKTHRTMHYSLQMQSHCRQVHSIRPRLLFQHNNETSIWNRTLKCDKK